MAVTINWGSEEQNILRADVDPDESFHFKISIIYVNHLITRLRCLR